MDIFIDYLPTKYFLTFLFFWFILPNHCFFIHLSYFSHNVNKFPSGFMTFQKIKLTEVLLGVAVWQILTILPGIRLHGSDKSSGSGSCFDLERYPVACSMFKLDINPTETIMNPAFFKINSNPILYFQKEEFIFKKLNQ